MLYSPWESSSMELRHHRAAVHVDRLPRDSLRRVARQEDRQRGHFLRLDEPPLRAGLFERLAGLPLGHAGTSDDIGYAPLGHGGVHVAGADSVNGNAVAD